MDNPGDLGELVKNMPAAPAAKKAGSSLYQTIAGAFESFLAPIRYMANSFRELGEYFADYFSSSGPQVQTAPATANDRGQHH